MSLLPPLSSSPTLLQPHRLCTIPCTHLASSTSGSSCLLSLCLQCSFSDYLHGSHLHLPQRLLKYLLLKDFDLDLNFQPTLHSPHSWSLITLFISFTPPITFYQTLHLLVFAVCLYHPYPQPRWELHEDGNFGFFVPCLHVPELIVGDS